MKTFISLAILLLSISVSAQVSFKKISKGTLANFEIQSPPTECIETGGGRYQRVWTARQAIRVTLKDGSVFNVWTESESREDYENYTGSCAEAINRLKSSVQYTALALFSISTGDVEERSQDRLRLCTVAEWNVMLEGENAVQVNRITTPTACPN